MTATPPDQLAISDILHAHCRGLDRNDSTLLASCYWPEAEVNYGNFIGPAAEFCQLIGPALAPVYELTRHCVSNFTIQINGEQAHCESYVEAAHLLRGAEQEMCFSGRYLDRLEKRDGHWRMVHRHVVMDWSRTRAITDERQSEGFVALSKGTAGDDDPSIQFFRKA
ncbi:nuclear transport factor 2 family protein [Halioglobus maricola]|nr:nuclear transport factor 2 family protein [Halioglobus maricola]